MNDLSKTNDRFLLLISFSLLSSGIILLDEAKDLSVVRYINSIFGTSLDAHFRSIGLSYLSTFFIFAGLVSLLQFLRTRHKPSNARFNYLSFGLLVVHYFYYLSANAKNFPIYDDQGAILNFLLKYNHATQVSDKINTIAAPYNESFMVFPRVFVLCWMKITGSVNFRQLVIFNGLLLLFLSYFLFIRSRKKNFSPALILPIGIFIFQFQYFDDAFWAISGLCYYGAIVFTLLAFYFLLEKNPVNNILAAACSLISTFTFGNGLISVLLCIFFLLIEKRYRDLAIWLIAFIVTIVIYSRWQAEIKPLTAVNWNPFENILFILLFLGSAFQFFYSPVLPILAGIFIIALYIFLVIKKEYKKSPFHFLAFTFLILSAFAASPLRSGLEPNGFYGLRGRYGIFSILAFALAVSYLVQCAEFTKKMKASLFDAAFTYHALTGIFFFPEVVIRRENIEPVIAGLRARNFEMKYSTIPKKEIDAIMNAAMDDGIYQP